MHYNSHSVTKLDILQKQKIAVPLDVDETSEWCSGFILVPKANGKVQLCQDPTRLNRVLISADPE